MILSIRGCEARPLSTAMVAARAFIGVSVVTLEYFNTGWICILGGFVLALPLALMIDLPGKGRFVAGTRLRKLAWALVFALAIYECTALTRLILKSTLYCGLDQLQPLGTTLVTLAFCGLMAVKNGRGLGNGARIWGIVFLVLFSLVVLSQVGNFQFYWLFPILGPGVRPLARGCLETAGVLAGAMTPLLFREDETGGKHCALRSLSAGCAVATALCLYEALMSPSLAMGSASQLSVLDALLANGRASLALMLPMVVLWFTGVFTTLTGYGFTGAAALQGMTGLDGRVCVWGAMGLILILTLTGISGRKWFHTAEMGEYLLAICAMALLRIGKRRANP